MFKEDSPVQVRLLLLDVDRVEGVEAEPGGEGETRLVRPAGEGRDHDGRACLPGEREKHIRTGPKTLQYRTTQKQKRGFPNPGELNQNI